MKVLVAQVALLAQLPLAAAVSSLVAAATGRAASRAGRRSATALEPALYGPGQCVSLGRSPVGSCTLSTSCEGQDISKFEFAFDCEGENGGIVRHSFGTGGFDSNEDFDTEVSCKTCYVPSPWAPKSAAAPTTSQNSVQTVAAFAKESESARKAAAAEEDADEEAARKAVEEEVAAKRAAKAARKAAEEEEEAAKKAAEEAEAAKKAAEEKVAVAASAAHPHGEEPSAPAAAAAATGEEASKVSHGPVAAEAHLVEAVRFGPRNCVSTYRSADGHCVLKTACDALDIKNYEFGLVCVDKGGASVRHLFGQDSFDAEETFDTLISCEKCLGLQDMSNDVALTGRVEALASEVQGLKVALSNLTQDIKELKRGNAVDNAGIAHFAASEPVAPMNRHLRHQLRVHKRDQNRWDQDQDGNAEKSDDEEAPSERHSRRGTHFLHRRQSHNSGTAQSRSRHLEKKRRVAMHDQVDDAEVPDQATPAADLAVNSDAPAVATEPTVLESTSSASDEGSADDDDSTAFSETSASEDSDEPEDEAPYDEDGVEIMPRDPDA